MSSPTSTGLRPYVWSTRCGRSVAAEVDVGDEAGHPMIDTAVELFGGLDVLHNNASDAVNQALDMDIVDLDMTVFDRLVAVNLKGQFMGCKHAIPQMLSRGGARLSTRHRSRASSVAASAPLTVRPKPVSCS